MVWVDVSPFPKIFRLHVKLWGCSKETPYFPCFLSPRKVSPTPLMVTNRQWMLGFVCGVGIVSNAISSTKRYHSTMIFIFSIWECILCSTFVYIWLEFQVYMGGHGDPVSYMNWIQEINSPHLPSRKVWEALLSAHLDHLWCVCPLCAQRISTLDFTCQVVPL